MSEVANGIFLEISDVSDVTGLDAAMARSECSVRCRRRVRPLQDAGHASDGDHLLDCNDPFGDSFLLNHDGARMPISCATPVKQRVADKSRRVSPLTRVYARMPRWIGLHSAAKQC